VNKLGIKELIAFEERIKREWEAGRIRCPHHFCGGNEVELLNYFYMFVKPGDWVFSTHRNAYHYLLHTDNTEYLFDQIVNRRNSMHIIDLPNRFVSTGIVGGNCAPAVGTALGIKLAGGNERVHCFVGDGACDQGWFFEALRYAAGQELPITFIIEDNDRSVATPYKERWGKGQSWPQVFNGPEYVYRYKYTPNYPHVGTGKHVEFM